MASWKSRGLRGSVLEETINLTNERYRQKGLALVQKIPTSIIPLEIDNKTRKITNAYFEKKSTVDYIGNVQGVPVCFDAKECTKSYFPIHNVHEHQMEYMEDFEKQQGISFFIIYFSQTDEYYYVPYRDMKVFWERAKGGGRQSFRISELDVDYRVSMTNQIYLHYLDALSRDLESRDE